jgi:hypothetical protein
MRWFGKHAIKIETAFCVVRAEDNLEDNRRYKRDEGYGSGRISIRYQETSSEDMAAELPLRRAVTK